MLNKYFSLERLLSLDLRQIYVQFTGLTEVMQQCDDQKFISLLNKIGSANETVLEKSRNDPYKKYSLHKVAYHLHCLTLTNKFLIFWNI